MLTQRLIGIKQSETKRGTVTQLQIDQAVEIARLQAKIERGLAGELDIAADAEQKLRLILAEDSYDSALTGTCAGPSDGGRFTADSSRLVGR